MKTIIVAAGSGLVAFFEPVYNPMKLLLILALFDILWGLVAGLRVDNERFRFRKFILAAGYCAIYLSVIALIYVVGHFQGDTSESLYIVKTITYVFIYFYGTNILKNLCRLFPANRVLGFLFFVLGLEFTKRMDWIERFREHEKKQTTKDNG